ncbi:MAG: protein-L-isoaspartate(D-aspartate) O-methyltransferase [Candidatus Omnitrophota bacterium]
MNDIHEKLRNAMVDMQLVPRGIHDELVLAAFRKVPRHRFVLQDSQSDAYKDNPLSIGCGQTISQPYMVALMSECLALVGGEKVLEVGTGSGYQAAILAEIAGEVYSAERIPQLAKKAITLLDELGYKNIKIQIDDGTEGWREYAPYDGIIVTAGAPSIPNALLEQLKDPGRLVIPVGTNFGQMLKVVSKAQGKIETTDVCYCVFVPLIGKHGWSKGD